MTTNCPFCGLPVRKATAVCPLCNERLVWRKLRPRYLLSALLALEICVILTVLI
jgi:endogenous inhibitor of DNA gyrase (YacG/DUF329 family)